MSTEPAAQEPKPSKTYQGGCHCGYIKFDVTLSPPLEDGHKVNQCNCSACTRLGYLLVYPLATDVTWHGESRARCANYRFNTKQKDQMFCPKCGASLGIDFLDVFQPPRYGISARTIYGVDLRQLTYFYGQGMQKIEPAGDTSGQHWDEEKQEMR